MNTYPRLWDSLSRARITERHAQEFVSLLGALAPETAASLADEALALAEAHPVGAFRRRLRALVERTRVQTVPERYEAELSRRRLYVEQVGDGMAWTHHYGPAVEAHAMFDRVTRMAKQLAKVEGETRTLDQLRADILADLALEGDTMSHPARARGIRPTVVVTVPALALLDDEHAAASDPAVVEGIGPIAIETARRLCGGAGSWMRVLTHPETGMVLSVGADQYEPPAPLKRLVKWRADRCLAPGCHMPASRCEVDHTIPFPRGHTSLTNLAPLCKGHHIVKHHGGWSVAQLDGGDLRWVSPAGRVYLEKPERRVPVFRPIEDGTPAPF